MTQTIKVFSENLQKKCEKFAAFENMKKVECFYLTAKFDTAPDIGGEYQYARALEIGPCRLGVKMKMTGSIIVLSDRIQAKCAA